MSEIPKIPFDSDGISRREDSEIPKTPLNFDGISRREVSEFSKNLLFELRKISGQMVVLRGAMIF